MSEKLTQFAAKAKVEAYSLATTAFKYRRQIFSVILLGGIVATALYAHQSVLASGDFNPIDSPVCSNPDTGASATIVTNLEEPSLELALSTQTPLSISQLCDQAAAVIDPGHDALDKFSRACDATLTPLGQTDGSINLQADSQGLLVFKERMYLFPQQWQIRPYTLGELTCATPKSQGMERFGQFILKLIKSPQGIITLALTTIGLGYWIKSLFENSEGALMERHFVRSEADELVWGQNRGRLTLPAGAKGLSSVILNKVSGGKNDQVMVKVGQILPHGENFIFDHKTVRYVQLSEADYWRTTDEELARDPDSNLPVKIN